MVRRSAAGDSGLEQPLVLDGIEPPVAPGVAAQQPPAGQDKPAQYAELADRLRGVFRARRVVLAALPEQRRDQPLVQRGSGARPAGGHAPCSASGAARPALARRRARDLVDQFGQRRARLPARPSRSARLLRIAATRDDDRVGVRPAGASLSCANASRSSRLTRLRSTAPPTLRETDRPSRGAVVARRAGTRRARAPGRRATGRGGTRGRTQRCATAAPDLAAAAAPGAPTHQTVRRLRPLSRRRLSVRRPARVCMRARKPCVRARLRFFGW